ncbi:Crp/Fnr family transcriptional regulator [Adhaeribacter radiodurans]|uniref:Crp/Fnr family transcriptional regulator n=1 Tax=Adhaeribacter radiodurans TaxID=2745197 RepID=A0A7L7LCZ3_9BACT|nr:Crp/Fnr family transcriptional regulator [Adhaeribacter radiodurans]QMU30627.1 Crp/Fnr family transcriptional regulator [Adhaeribacter radiodurans]
MTPKDLLLFNQTIQKYSEVSSSSFNILADHCQLERLGRFEHLIQERTRNDFEYFLIQGIAHRYNVTEAGELITTGFYMPQTAITPNFARTNNGVSLFAVQALTDIILIKIRVTDLDTLRNTYIDLRLFGQRVVEQQLAAILRLEMAFRSMTAKERLALLRKEYVNVENFIPHTIIASFLGVTPVSFSRLRSEIG